MNEDEVFAYNPDFPMPEIGPEWDAEVLATVEMTLVAQVEVDPPLGPYPATIHGTLTFGDRIVFLHSQELEGETFTELMMEEHIENMMVAFQQSLYVPSWWT